MGRSTDNSSAYDAVAVTPSDATILPATRALYIGTAGDLVVVMAKGAAPVTFSDAPAGVLPVQVVQVMAATAALDILALY